MKKGALDFSNKNLKEIPFKEIDKLTSWLILSYNKIQKIPKEITKLNQIQRLALNDNKISEIDDSLSDLRNLNWMDLTRNNLKNLPDNLFLFNLIGLGLSENEFTEIPECVYKFIELRKFGFFFNKVSFISPNIKNLINLTKLDLSNNLIEELPHEICFLRNLTWLNLSHNKIKKLPQNFGKLHKIEELGLGKNLLTELSNLSDMKSLRILSLFDNKLKSFEVENYTIRKIDLSNNELTTFPDSILKITCLETINLKNNKIKEINLKFPIISNLKSIDLSGNQIEFIPFKFIKSIEACKFVNLSENKFVKKDDQFPQPPSLKNICLTTFCNTSGKAEIKTKNLCDFCYRLFVYDPIIIYYRAFLENGDSFVLKEEICRSKCYFASIKCKNEDFDCWVNK